MHHGDPEKAPKPGASAPKVPARTLTDKDRAALKSIGTSGLFTLEKSLGMYAEVKSVRPAS